MAIPESELTQTAGLATRSLVVLRRMRAAAISDLTIRHKLFPPEADYEIDLPDVALVDAKSFGEFTADFLVSKIVAEEDDEDFENYLEYYEQRYRDYQPFAKHSENAAEIGKGYVRFLDGLRALSWNQIAEGYPVSRTGIRFVDFEEYLSGPSVGTFAPLSNDYLQALCVARYVQEVHPTASFDIQPVALNPGSILFKAKFPRDEHGDLFFLDKSRIGLFVEVHSSRSTIKTLEHVTRSNYPDKLITRLAGADYYTAM